MRGSGKYLIIYSLIALQVFLGVTIGFTAQAFYSFQNHQTVADSMEVMGINLQGLTQEEVYKKLKYETKKLPSKIIFIYESDKYFLDVNKIKLEYQIQAIIKQIFEGNGDRPVSLSYTYDREAAEQWLEQVAQTINEDSVNARVVNINNQYQVKTHKTGKKLDIKQTIAHLEKSIEDYLLKKQEPIPLVVEKVHPDIKKEDITGMTVLLGESLTRYNTEKENRVHNLILAATSLQGIIQPGEEFSFQQQLGPFEQEKGYKEANVLINAEIQEGIGGGVCQVSSTFYHAGLKSMMEVVEQHPHSVPVNYIPIGMDATVDNGHIDLVFRNPLEKPVYFQSEVDDGSLKVSFYTNDKSLKKDVKITTSDVTILPREIKFQPSDRVPLGKPKWEQKGQDGYQIKVWRIISDGNEMIERELISVNTYPKKDDILLYHPDETEAVLEAWKQKIEREGKKDSVAELG